MLYQLSQKVISRCEISTSETTAKVLHFYAAVTVKRHITQSGLPAARSEISGPNF